MFPRLQNGGLDRVYRHGRAFAPPSLHSPAPLTAPNGRVEKQATLIETDGNFLHVDIHPVWPHESITESILVGLWVFTILRDDHITSYLNGDVLLQNRDLARSHALRSHKETNQSKTTPKTEKGH